MTKEELKKKIVELRKIEKEISKMKSLYKRRDDLFEEILPNFVSLKGKTITIKSEIIIEGEKIMFSPVFVDKGSIKNSNWKSVNFQNFTIE